MSTSAAGAGRAGSSRVRRQPVDVAVPEIPAQLGGGEGVEVVVGRHQQGIGDLLELGFAAERVDQHPAAIGVEAG